MSDLFSAVFTRPLYNGLAFLVSVIPGGDIGIAVIVLTIIVKFLILPLSHKALTSQAKMKELEPEIKKIKERYKDKKEEIAKRTMALYKEKGVHPFSGCLPLLIQMPVVMALYFVFYRGGATINPTLLYSFVHAPATINTHLFGLIDLTHKSILLAVIAGLAQFLHTRISLPAPAPSIGSEKPSFSEEFTKSMNMQMKYVFPIMVGGIAYAVSGVVALYLATSNTFSLMYELYMRRNKK